MAIETETISKAVQRSNDLAVETAQTLVDAAYSGPRQALELNQVILQNMAAYQQRNRDLAGTLVRQTVEAQTLWWQFFQTSLQLGVETFTRAAEASRANMRDQERKLAEAATMTDKRTVAAVNK